MTAEATPQKLQINFAALVGSQRAPTPPAQAAIGTLMVANQGTIEPVEVTRTLLSEEARQEARVAALELYPLVRDNRVYRGNWANEIFDPLNNVVSLILREQGKMNYSDIDKYLNEMNDAVDNYNRKHGSDDGKTYERLEAVWNAASKLLGELKRFAKDRYRDALETEQKLNRVVDKVGEHKAQLEESVAMCDQLIQKNEAACTDLIGVIAIMEQIIMLAQEEGVRLNAELESLPEGSVDRRNKTRELETVMQLRRDYEKRITAFTGRLGIAWTTTPLTEKMQTVSYEVAQRLGMLIVLTIPALKQFIAQLGMLARIEAGVDTSTRIEEATDNALALLGVKAVDVHKKAGQLVESSLFRPDSLLRLMNTVVEINHNALELTTYGRQQNAALVTAFRQGYTNINSSQEALQQAQLAAFTVATSPLEIAPAPELPEEVLQYAAQNGLAVPA